MSISLNRRGFLQAAGAAGLGIGCGAVQAGLLRAADATSGASRRKQSGPLLVCATYSFNKFSFLKAAETAKGLGIRAVEGFAWQALADDKPGAQLNDGMSEADCKDILSRLEDQGVRLIGCYSNPPKGDAYPKTFAWAEKMKLDYLVAEPPLDAYVALDALCEKHQIRLAIHNHARPNPNWNPVEVVERVKDRSPWRGLCCDTGHWVRSGLDPVAMLQKAEGRIVGIHLKDVASADDKEGRCVPFGKGVCNIAGVLAELGRQKFQGPCAIEYEPYAPENVEYVAECVAFFEKTIAGG